MCACWNVQGSLVIDLECFRQAQQVGVSTFANSIVQSNDHSLTVRGAQGMRKRPHEWIDSWPGANRTCIDRRST